MAIITLAALLAVCVTCLLAVGVTWGALKAVRVARLAREMRDVAGSLRQEAAALQDTEDIPATLESGRATLSEIEALLEELRQEIGPFDETLKGLGWVPVYGDDLVAVPYALDMLDALLGSVRQLDAAVGPLLDRLEAGQASDQNILVTIAETIEAAEGPLADARAELAAARAARQSIPDTESLSPQLGDAILDATRAIETLELALTTIDALPPLLGTQTPHHILILLQNADELKPTGGWITASVYLVIERGQITELTVLNSTGPEIDRFDELPYEEPPDPLRDYMHLPIWAFRDANWSPDFPTAATKASQLYTLGRGVPVDTVVAINQHTLHDILASIGPVTLADGTLVDADNIVGFLQDSWEPTPHKKDFIPALAPVLIDSMLDVGDMPGMLARVRALGNAAKQGNLLIYSSDPAVQTAVERLGWDGSLPIQPGDYLYVVDANVGYNKTDLNIARRMAYHISLVSPTTPYGVLELEYLNQSQGEPGVCRSHRGREGVETYAERSNDCYADFLRLYLPDGAEVVQSPWFALPTSYEFVSDPTAGQVKPLPDERGKEVFGGLMVVPPGMTAPVSFAYRLPPAKVLALGPDGRLVYSLTIQKQPGVPAYPVSITVDLPPGATVVSVTPEPTYQGTDQLYFEVQLRADLHVEVAISVPDEAQQAVAAHLAPPAPTSAATSTPRLVPTQPPLPTPDIPTPTPSPSPTAAPEIVVSLRAHLRTGPDTSSDSITVLDAGERVTLLGRDQPGTWLLVRAGGGQEGWVSAELIEGPLDLSSVPVVASP